MSEMATTPTAEELDPPTWPLTALGAVFAATLVGFVLALPAGMPWLALPVVLYLATYPLLFYDARQASRYRELHGYSPIWIPLAAILCWILVIPGWILYRLYG